MTPNTIGRIVWHDLTVLDAPRVREFYEKVMGWSNMPIAMEDDQGDYADYVMLAPENSQPPVVPPEHASGVCGVCHARGSNANLPPQWLVYVQVASVNASIAAAESLGGKLLCPSAGWVPASSACCRTPQAHPSASSDPSDRSTRLAHLMNRRHIG